MTRTTLLACSLMLSGCTSRNLGEGSPRVGKAEGHPPVLSEGGRVWLLRLRPELDSRNPLVIEQLSKDLEYKRARGDLGEEDYRILKEACSLALKRRWADAYAAVGLRAPDEGPADGPNGLPWASKGTVTAHGVEVPLPEGAVLIERRAGDGQLQDDRWRFRFVHGGRIREFYLRELSRRGWHLDRLDAEYQRAYPGSGWWTKPRAGSRTNEIVTVRVRGADEFEISIAP